MPEPVAAASSGSWSPLSAPQDFAIVAGRRTPGIARVEGFKTRSRWDVRQGPALTGARLRYRGFEPARGKLIIKLTAPDHWAGWWDFAPTVRRAPLGERATHLEIQHPILDAMDIHTVAVESVGQPTPVDEKGTWEIEIELLEYLEPLPAASTPDGSDTGDAVEQTDTRRQMADEAQINARLLAGDPNA